MKKPFSTTILFSLSSFFLLVPLAHAVEYVPMTGFFEGVGTDGTENFISTLYGMAITIAALLAVIKIIYAGVQYMLTDVITTKGSAKKEIYGAILGLLIVLTAVFILEIINPDLLSFSLLYDETPTYPGDGTPAEIPAVNTPD